MFSFQSRPLCKRWLNNSDTVVYPESVSLPEKQRRQSLKKTSIAVESEMTKL